MNNEYTIFKARKGYSKLWLDLGAALIGLLAMLVFIGLGFCL